MNNKDMAIVRINLGLPEKIYCGTCKWATGTPPGGVGMGCKRLKRDPCTSPMVWPNPGTLDDYKMWEPYEGDYPDGWRFG